MRIGRIGTLMFPLLCLGCGGGDDGGVTTPSAVDPTGEWMMTWTETSSTCAPAQPPESHAVELTLVSSGTELVWQDDGDTCDGSSDFGYDDNRLVIGSYSDDFMGLDGCTYRETLVSASGSFTTTTFSSSYIFRYSVVAGTACTEIAVSPCEIRTTITGSKCQGCYGGCTLAATEVRGQRPLLRRPR